MTPWLIAVFCLVTADCSNVTDQETSESQRNQVAILKQIRKLNDDGSYSYGYEAGDGSFKVENRDVLGNIKGTFGFVDADGETKRISYSSLNGTGFKVTSVSPLQEQLSVVQSIPRVNRSLTTKKPTITYATSTESSTSKSSVVQTIPRTRKPSTTTSTTTTTVGPSESPRPIFGHYVKPTPKSRPRFVLTGQQKQTPVDEDTSVDDSQITKPTTEEKAPTYRRILFAKRPIDHTLRPITEEFEEKEEEATITSGNVLRRQLHEETTKSEPIRDNVNEDHAHVYGSSTLSTTRPLFTTTNSPRLLHRITGLRTERPKTIYVNRNNLGPAKFDNDNKYESTRVYEDETKLTDDDRESSQQIPIRGHQRISDEDRDYARQEQRTEPVYVQQHPESYFRDLLSAGLLVPETNVHDDSAYRTQIPIGRIIYRPHPNQQPMYSTKSDTNVHYLTETPMNEPDENSRLPMVQDYPRPRAFQRPLMYADQEPSPRPRSLLRPIPQQIPQPIDDSEYPLRPSVNPEYVHRSNPIDLPPELPKPISLPLSRRDFQILLRRLLVSRYGVEALAYPRTYLEEALYDQQSHPSYQLPYQPPQTRQTRPYDPSNVPRRYGDRVPISRQTYARGIDPHYQPRPYDDYDEERYAKRIYRQKFYGPEVNDDGEEILPPAVREALLLRMLQLAIHSERPTMATLAGSTTVPTTMYRKNGPVRSVQIISDDDDDENDSVRNKT